MIVALFSKALGYHPDLPVQKAFAFLKRNLLKALVSCGALGSLSKLSYFAILTNLLKTEELSELPQAGAKALCLLPVFVCPSHAADGRRKHTRKRRGIWAHRVQTLLLPRYWTNWLYSLTRHLQMFCVLEHLKHSDFKGKSKWTFYSITQGNGAATRFCSILASPSRIHKSCHPQFNWPEPHIFCCSAKIFTLVSSVFGNEKILMSSKTIDLYLGCCIRNVYGQRALSDSR